jgi:hypothetical protein
MNKTIDTGDKVPVLTKNLKICLLLLTRLIICILSAGIGIEGGVSSDNFIHDIVKSARIRHSWYTYTQMRS